MGADRLADCAADRRHRQGKSAAEMGRGPDRMRPLWLPAAVLRDPGNYPAMLRWLLGEGADVHQSDEFGTTALIEAVEADDLECVEILLEAGANVEVNANGTAISRARCATLSSDYWMPEPIRQTPTSESFWTSELPRMRPSQESRRTSFNAHSTQVRCGKPGMDASSVLGGNDPLRRLGVRGSLLVRGRPNCS